jgi:hypothetical protein
MMYISHSKMHSLFIDPLFSSAMWETFARKLPFIS